MAPQIKIFHHSCGSIYKIIEDIIESSVEIFNPVQPLAADMDSFRLKKESGDRLCFHCRIDEQIALPGAAETLVIEVKTCINALAPSGGYIIASISNIQDDTSSENILIYIKTAKGYGQYKEYYINTRMSV